MLRFPLWNRPSTHISKSSRFFNSTTRKKRNIWLTGNQSQEVLRGEDCLLKCDHCRTFRFVHWYYNISISKTATVINHGASHILISPEQDSSRKGSIISEMKNYFIAIRENSNRSCRKRRHFEPFRNLISRFWAMSGPVFRSSDISHFPVWNMLYQSIGYFLLIILTQRIFFSSKSNENKSGWRKLVQCS